MNLSINIKRTLCFVSTLSLLLCVVFLYSYFIDKNKDITDARNYFYFFTNILEVGLIESTLMNYVGGGKFEPVLLIFYKFYSFLHSSEIGFKGFYWFVFYNYVIITAFTLYLINLYSEHLTSSSKYSIIFISFLLSFFWFPSYLNMLWVWRANMAYSFVLLSLYFFLKKRMYVSIAFVVIATLTHYSSFFLILLIYFFYFLSFKYKRLSIGIKTVVTIILALLSSFFYAYVKSIVSSGDALWAGDYYLRYFILFYFILGLLLFSIDLPSLKPKVDYSSYSLIVALFLFFIFSVIVSMLGASNYQDSFRIMHFSYLSFCLFFPIVLINSSIYVRIISFFYLFFGIASTLYLFFNFFKIQ